MTRRHIHQCCGQPCSNTTGGPSPAVATCQRARSTSTSMWTTPGSGGGVEGKATTPVVYSMCSGGGGQGGLSLLLLVQMLVRRAVAVVRQRRALAGLALARRGAAL